MSDPRKKKGKSWGLGDGSTWKSRDARHSALPAASRANLIRARLIPLFLLPPVESPVRARAREDEG